MKEELNIAAILKEMPTGTKLFDIQKGIGIEFNHVEVTRKAKKTFIWCNYQKEGRTLELGYSEFGKERGWDNGMQILKPSKQMQDWSKFAWKKGDVLSSCGIDNICIFDKWVNDEYTEFNAKFVIPGYSDTFLLETKDWTKMANESVVRKNYIKEVEEHCGGKLNLETLEIDKQPEFKDGDIVTITCTTHSVVAIFKNLQMNHFDCYAYLSSELHVEDWLNIEEKELRLATEEEKQHLFDALAKENKRWNPDTKTIEDLPKKCEFKTMDWCLMRDIGDNIWKLCQFGFFHKVDDFDRVPYNAVGGTWYNECILYNEETAHLLGTTDEWKGGEG